MLKYRSPTCNLSWRNHEGIVEINLQVPGGYISWKWRTWRKDILTKWLSSVDCNDSQLVWGYKNHMLHHWTAQLFTNENHRLMEAFISVLNPHSYSSTPLELLNKLFVETVLSCNNCFVVMKVWFCGLLSSVCENGIMVQRIVETHSYLRVIIQLSLLC